MAKGKKKKKSIWFGVTIAVLLIAIIVAGIVLLSKLSFWKNTNSTPFGNNSSINGINISGRTKSEAIDAVSTYIKDKADDFTLTLKYNDTIYTLDHNDYTINDDVHTIVDMASKSSSYQGTLQELKYFTDNGNSTMVAFNYIFQGLDDKIEEIISQIETKPINSEITFDPDATDRFTITADHVGYVVDRDKLYNEINKQFVNNNRVLVDVVLEEQAPEVTEQYNKQLTSCITKFSTSVSDSTGGRKNNVKLALSKFNGMMVAPGESVSFNDITSPHTLDNGYQIATVISEGKFVDGVGGGVCQASTTLYNALLLSGMQIDEVHKHTLPVRYVPLALDAMVSGSSDMRFTNSTEYPIFIRTSSTADDVTVEIYSKTPDVQYKTRSKTIKELPALPDKVIADTKGEYSDKVLFKGETWRQSWGRKGYDTRSYMQTWKDGKMILETPLRHEVYQPQAGVIIEGTQDPIPEMPIISDTQDMQTLDMDNNFYSDTMPTNLCP